ncbi:hypothetical protein ACFSM3_03580 [Halomonas beimenensis]|uniref:Mu transposase domain-containing protein n=1 Tax=Halomonas beimenensis TaxID=475662 RepID=UPI00363D3DDC
MGRRVQRDATVEVDTNRYSVPWRLIGEAVQVSVTDGELRVHHAGHEAARHLELGGRRQVRRPAGAPAGHRRLPAAKADTEGAVTPTPVVATLPAVIPSAELQRDLTEYEAVVGGGW